MTLRDRLAKERQERQAAMLKEQLKKEREKKEDFYFYLAFPTFLIGWYIFYWLCYIFFPESWM